MCGISGFISNKKLIRNNAIVNTLDLMKNRGPDYNSSYTQIVDDKNISLLHSRLKIIDIHSSRSNQPYRYKNFILIFNGEIYNFIELRNKLKKIFKFDTSSDTEVLLKSYIAYGKKCVDHLEGMWSFAIWDIKKKSLFLSRDSFGEKPLFFYYSKDGFFFGSEIKYIKSLCEKNFILNKTQVKKNLFLGYKSLNKTTDTFYDKIFSLENGTNLTLDLKLNFKKEKYWQPKVKINKKMSLTDAVDGVRSLLLNSLKIRMRSDVPLAFCLSGGIDSGLLASIAKKKLNKKISTFSIIDRDPRYNESENIKLVNNDLGSDSNLINLNPNKYDFFDRLRNLTKYHDGPIATLSYYVHSFLMQNIAKKKIKVSISGTGADELFTGYYDHFLLHFHSLKKSKYLKKNINDWKKFILPTIRNPYLKNPFHYIDNPKNRELVFESNFNIKKYSSQKINYKFTEKKYTSELLRNRMHNELFHEGVPVILKHDDLNSMFYSVENRSPYLDRGLLNFAYSIPPHFLISDGYQKKILRDAGKNILINKVRLDRQKKGFNASINSVVNLNDKKIIDKIFNTKSPISEFINLELLKKDINFRNIPNHYSKLIFSIISTNQFLEENF